MRGQHGKMIQDDAMLHPLSRNELEKNLTPVMFLHIQKTAGTSIVEFAREYYAHSMISHGDFIGHDPEEFGSVLFISGHFGFNYAKKLMPSRYSFTFLRDPIKRLLSFYYFCKKQKHDEFRIYQVARNTNLLGFLEAASEDLLIRKNVWNNQVWQLAHGYFLKNKDTLLDFSEAWNYSPKNLLDLSILHLDEFSHVGFTETFEYDRNVILKALNLPIPEQEVIANATHNQPKIEDLSDSVKNILYELTELDRQLYAIEFSRRNLDRKTDNLNKY